MKKSGLLLGFMLLIINFAAADVYNSPSTLENISKQIPKVGSIKCGFKQEKFLKNIEKPIVSKGDFEFIENKGVYFNTTYPVKSKTDYTNKNYKQINDIVNAISAKKYGKLEKEFEFYFSGSKESWVLGMKPKKNSDAYAYISSITIDGSNYISKISISQTNGNKTVIWFKK